MSEENDKKFFTLFTIVVVGITILMIVFYFMGKEYGHNEMTPVSIKASPAPSGEASTAAHEEVAAAGPADGKTVYDQVCVACHSGALPGVPKPGDQADWSARLAQGKDALYDHAINGFMGATMPMPPKGGGSNSDEEVKAAVDYMLEGITAGAAASEEKPAEAVAAAAPEATAAAIDGKAIYDKVCVACHSGALPGVPKAGVKADWEPRIAKGVETLYANAINGFMGATMPMPPKGGAGISDDEAKAAVDYMLEGAK